MRQVLVVVATMLVSGCTGRASPPPPVDCAGTPIVSRSDRGDGTMVIDCGVARVLVCSSPDCSGITDLAVAGTDLSGVYLEETALPGSS